MQRGDISKNLVHWTKGETDDEAFETLKKILVEQRLLGGTGFIKGLHKCVCFTETPSHFYHIRNSKYKPFGIEFSKAGIFEMGGRPVIYQPDDEIEYLSPEIQWRHVTYNPISENKWTDFTWEREWRLKIDYLDFPDDLVIYVKSIFYKEELEKYLDEYYDHIALDMQLRQDHYYPMRRQVNFKIESISSRLYEYAGLMS